MILSKAISKVKLPIPKIPSFSLINLTTEYGVVPAITIESETNVNVTPHFLSAKRAEDEIIPTIAAGQPRLLAKVMFAALYGGIKIVIKVIVGRAIMLEINPSSAEAHNNIANLFSSLNNPEAEYHYKKTIELLPNEAYPLLNMANFLIKNGRFKDSIPLLKDLLDRGEESKEVYNSLGVAYKGIDDNENAKSMFNEALRVDPSFELAKKNMESLS